MTSECRVSIIIPTYNRPQLIVSAIDSILKQTYSHFEIIIIDDSSDNKTEDAIKGIGDDRIKYIHSKERLGVIESRNEGVRNANPASVYIAPLDDDDEYLPEYLEKTIAFMDAHPAYMAIGTDAETRRQDGKFVRTDRCEREKFWHASFGNGSLIRKDVFIKLNIWWDKEVLFEDLDFGVRITKKHKWGGIPEVLRIYNAYPAADSPEHLTHSKTQPQYRIERFLEKHRELYENAGPEAIAWILNLTGKVLVRNRYIKAGRKDLWGAVSRKPNITYIADYIIAVITPSLFTLPLFGYAKSKVRGILKR